MKCVEEGLDVSCGMKILMGTCWETGSAWKLGAWCAKLWLLGGGVILSGEEALSSFSIMGGAERSEIELHDETHRHEEGDRDFQQNVTKLTRSRASAVSSEQKGKQYMRVVAHLI